MEDALTLSDFNIKDVKEAELRAKLIFILISF